MKRSSKLFLVLGFTPMAAWALGSVSTLNLNFEQAVEAPRWMYDSKAKIKGGALIEQMVEAKKAFLVKDRTHCLQALQKTFGLGKSLGPWLAWNQLQCATLRDKSGAYSIEALQQALARLEAQPKWLAMGPAVSALRSSYSSALLALAEQQIKTDRRQAWSTLDKLQQVRTWLSAEDRASHYRLAGELAFIEQNLVSAQDFLLRSLAEKDNPELRTRVESIRSTLQLRGREGAANAPTAPKETPAASPAGSKSSSGPGLATKPTPAAKPNEDLGMSDEERDIATRLNRAYESQDYISAIEDGVELLQKFPGSRRATQAADRVLDIYLSLSARGDDKYRHVRETAVKEMQKVDAGRMSRWAANAYAKGNYMDALTLAERAYAKYAGHPDSTKVLLLAGKAALASGEYADARSHFDQLLKQHGGTPEAAEANFRLGLLEYRLGHYPEAAAFFERLLALAQGEDYEYRALYWQWRAQQHIDPAKSETFAQPLLRKYPLTYYGLRARSELAGQSLQLPSESVKFKIELRLLESDRLTWERYLVLLRAGWFHEAERELENMPEPQTAEERLVRAKYWAATLRYDTAINVVNRVLDENSAYLQTPVLQLIFPEEYATAVGRESKAQNLEPEWLWAIQRQESSFRPDVKSPAGAMGLMQLVPSTGQELARDMKIKDYNSDSLLQPETNIKLGGLYLARLIKNFSGHIPLALAAYNTGPTRLRRWLAARKDLSPLEAAASSAPEAEVWIDELPWDETSQYVKAVLRNWLIYKALDGSKLTLSEPIWVDAKKTSR